MPNPKNVEKRGQVNLATGIFTENEDVLREVRPVPTNARGIGSATQTKHRATEMRQDPSLTEPGSRVRDSFVVGMIRLNFLTSFDRAAYSFVSQGLTAFDYGYALDYTQSDYC